jgi:2-dehydro-3-deoxyglucarate aldolase
MLRAGRPVIGSWINSASPIIGEVQALCGYDFLTIDAEHSAVDLADVQRIFQGIRSGNPACACLVRAHGTDYAWVKRYLDAGAQGVIAPLVRSADEARLLIEATKYPPQGRRGVGFCRANHYGQDLAGYVSRANEEILVGVQIEDTDGVERIDDILSVPGVDAVFLGPYDLSASLGITGQFDHPDYLRARDHVLAACQRHGVAAGIHVVPPDPAQVIDRIREGYRMIAYSLDITLLAHASRAALAEIRAALPANPA